MAITAHCGASVRIGSSAPTISATEIAADCVLGNADIAERRALARDVGVRPGTLTSQNVTNIIRRPGTGACLRSRGVTLGGA